ncbi:MAG: hydrogenase, partial [Limisphaerales bacterium]
MASPVTDLKVAPPPIELEREPLVANNRSFGWISDRVAGIVEGPTPLWWWLAFIPSLLGTVVLGFMLVYQISVGVGVWGNNHPVMWGWDIINF